MVKYLGYIFIIYNQGSPAIFKDKHHYLSILIQLQTALNKIRIKIIDSRIYKDESDKNDKYYSKIQPGAIVSLVNPSLRKKIPNHKICPQYRDRFLVIRRTKSSAYITPCSEKTLDLFLRDIKWFQKLESRCLYKCDIEELKFIEDITLIVSNKHSKFYENFLVSNEFPKIYISMIHSLTWNVKFQVSRSLCKRKFILIKFWRNYMIL